MEIGEPIKYSVSDSVRESVSIPIYYLLWDLVRNSIWVLMWDSIRNSVRFSVWESIDNSVNKVYGDR